MEKRVKNGEIEIFRFIFCVIIMLQHASCEFSNIDIFRKNGYVGVEFFFVLTGFLMARSASKLQDIDKKLIPDKTYTFMKNKIVKFYGYFIIGIIIQALAIMIIGKESIVRMLMLLFNDIPNILLIKWGGFFMPSDELYVGGNWYISVMVLALFVLYPLLLSNYNWFSKIFFPIFGLFGLGYLCINYSIVGVVSEKTPLMIAGVIRGACEIALGVWAYEMTLKFKQIQFTKLSKLILTLIKYGCISMICFYAYSDFAGLYGFLMVIFSLCAVSLSFSDKTYVIPSNAVTDFLGKVTLPIYLTHLAFMRKIAKPLFGKDMSIEGIIVLLIFCLIGGYLVMLIKDFCSLIYKKTKHLFVTQEK